MIDVFIDNGAGVTMKDVLAAVRQPGRQAMQVQAPDELTATAVGGLRFEADDGAIAHIDAVRMQDLVAQAVLVFIAQQQLMQEAAAVAVGFAQGAILVGVQAQMADFRHEGVEAGKISQKRPYLLDAEVEQTTDIDHDRAHPQGLFIIRDHPCIPVTWRRGGDLAYNPAPVSQLSHGGDFLISLSIL